MGWSADTITPSSRARSYIPSNTQCTKCNKNGLVRYFLNNKQVTETQYKETFADTIPNEGNSYTGDMHHTQLKVVKQEVVNNILGRKIKIDKLKFIFL